ncbi:uncharacterized protein LOC124942541 isoform X2 [Impatiens glandulifera]|uniref:uncharacterized protein LOC124942541 isoform X2 n=1 Tax=Impatiens glandulifera TaxID=253017 RepID=UPI001FB05445|nr:uncharacterized protein LOC124942541 isoform X2 [Impatiens glandulifera]
MASVRSSQPPSSPASASNSEISSTQPPPAPAPAPALPASLQHQDAAIDNGIRDALERKPLLVDPFEDMNSEEYIERFSKYEADYTCRLMAKYFSDKDIYGGGIVLTHMQTQHSFFNKEATAVRLLLKWTSRMGSTR